jgi:disulfide oxidoreductase YuzD
MKKKVFLLTMLLSLLLLSGCGVNLSSKIKLNKDFSGTRTMSCTFSSRDFNAYFKGSKEDLNKLIKESCPDSLTYTSSSDGENDTYTFYLRFSSLDDYKKKVSDLLNFSPDITYEYGDSPFVNGLIYKENFTSKDLMTWLYTALYEKKYIDKDSSSDLWDLKTTQISFLGKTYETKDKININEMTYVPLSSIDIDTITEKSGKLTKKIKFNIPQKTLDQNSGKIRSYFDRNDITWENTSDGKILCISFNANNFSDLAQKTRSVLHSKSSFGTYNSTCSEDNPFKLKINYKESLDVSNFLSKKGSVPVTYTFNGKQIFNDSIKDKEISFTSSITQPISKYEIAVVWNTSKDIRRKVSFSFRKMITTHQLSILKKQFQGPTISDVTLSGTKTITLSFVQTGSISECNKDFSALFKNSAMTAKEHFSLTAGRKINFSDKIALPFNENGKKLSGHYIFASINPKESISVSITPAHNVKNKTKQNTSTKTISELVHSDENIHDLCDFELTGNSFQANYQGNTAASFWMNVLKWGIPVIVLILILLFLFRKKATIHDMFHTIKQSLSEKINTFIDKINKL